MKVDPALAMNLLLLLGMAIVVTLLLRARGRDHALREAISQLSGELRQQEHATQQRHQNLQQQMLEQERSRSGELGELTLDLQQRLAEALSRHGTIALHLRQALSERLEGLTREVSRQLAEGRSQTVHALAEMREQTGARLSAHQTRFERRHGEALQAVNDSLRQGMDLTRRQVSESLSRSTRDMGQRLDQLTARTDRRLKQISGEVEKRLSDGFEKTTATFNDVLKRLALIDEAQKKIAELSSNVVSLQQVLSDKRSRGAFGEVQLKALVSNVLPAQSYALQHTLGNGRRADCVLFLPPPTGTIAIDSKFPLESYQKMTDIDASELERRAAARQFKLDVRSHVKAIAGRYIIPGETSDGAIMFVPAEAVFAEIQAHHPEVVNESQRARVWMASPTTLMAILNTAAAVLKDEATRRQMHVIRRHLSELALDFQRFGERMDKLSLHIDQARRDVDQVHVSARKISARFETIEKVEMEGETALPAEHEGGAAAGGEATGPG